MSIPLLENFLVLCILNRPSPSAFQLPETPWHPWVKGKMKKYFGCGRETLILHIQHPFCSQQSCLARQLVLVVERHKACQGHLQTCKSLPVCQNLGPPSKLDNQEKRHLVREATRNQMETLKDLQEKRCTSHNTVIHKDIAHIWPVWEGGKKKAISK